MTGNPLASLGLELLTSFALAEQDLVARDLPLREQLDKEAAGLPDIILSEVCSFPSTPSVASAEEWRADYGPVNHRGTSVTWSSS